MDNVWSVLGVLAVVILILYLAYWVTRWIGMRSMPQSASARVRTGGSGKFCVLGQLGLGGRNERLVLVRLEERCYLLGVTEHQITLLRELDDGEAAEWLREDGQPSAPGFMEVLAENLRKKK